MHSYQFLREFVSRYLRLSKKKKKVAFFENEDGLVAFRKHPDNDDSALYHHLHGENISSIPVDPKMSQYSRQINTFKYTRVVSFDLCRLLAAKAALSLHHSAEAPVSSREFYPPGIQIIFPLFPSSLALI